MWLEGDQDNEDGDEEGAEEGTYFIDQSGHYYYQASSDQQPVMAVVSGVDGGDEEEEFVISPDGEDGVMDGDEVSYNLVMIIFQFYLYNI